MSTSDDKQKLDNHALLPSEPFARQQHSHIGDIGFSSFLGVLYCLFAALPVFSAGAHSAPLSWILSAAFLAFIGSTCITLLFLSIFQLHLNRAAPMLYPHAGKTAALLMSIGPAALLAEQTSGHVSSFPLVLCFMVSGTGYAAGIIEWGRILTTESEPSTTHRIVADSCAASVAMMIVALIPSPFSMAAIIILCFASGLSADSIGRSFPPACFKKQIVLSDTRNAIPRYSYLFSGMLWLIFGLSWSTWNGDAVFGAIPNASMFLAIALAVAGTTTILLIHKGTPINVERIFWLSGSFTVAGLGMLATGMRTLSNLAIVLLVIAMIVAGIQLWCHFAALSRRDGMIPEQMFGWGWLSPFLGLFAGIVIGVACSTTGSTLLMSLAPSLAGVFVIAVTIAQRNIDNIIKKRNKANAEKTAAAQRKHEEERLHSVFSEKGLTVREAQVAALVLQGRSQPVIAEQLFVATSTVNTHVKHIYQKFGVRSKQELIDACEEALTVSKQASK